MELFGITDATINTGVFRPAGHDSIWIFITEEKTADRTPYQDHLEGDILYFEGQSAGRTDQLIREHAARGLEIVLFHRTRRDELPDFAFRYEGEFEYVSSETGPPTRFRIRRKAALTAVPAPLEVVRNANEIRKNILRFNSGCTVYRERGAALISQTTYWVWDPETGLFGPSKFCGFREMNFARYEEAVHGESSGTQFSGGLTREAIEGVAGLYTADAGLTQQLESWIRRTIDRAPGAIDSSKWRFVKLKTVRQFFALACNPDRFDGRAAVAALPELAWTVNRMEPRAGDRVILWQTKGRGKRRGVIAIGEITRGPIEEPCPDAEAAFWVEEMDGVRERIRFRTYDAPGLPLWEQDGHEWLADLKVARATGGTVFSLEPDEWARIAAAVQCAAPTTDEVGYRSRRGQGYGLSTAENRVVERYAQSIVEMHFERLGFNVTDTSRGNPYDLCCVSGDVEFHVEVKGSTGDAGSVFLTYNEVEHARAADPRVVIAVVKGIRLDRDSDPPRAHGGELCVVDPWTIRSEDLTPVEYRYRIPDYERLHWAPVS